MSSALIEITITAEIVTEVKAKITNGQNVYSFAVPVEGKKVGEEKITDWWNVNVFAGSEEWGLSKYLIKGAVIQVRGLPDINTYTDSTQRVRINLGLTTNKAGLRMVKFPKNEETVQEPEGVKPAAPVEKKTDPKLNKKVNPIKEEPDDLPF